VRLSKVDVSLKIGLGRFKKLSAETKEADIM